LILSLAKGERRRSNDSVSSQAIQRVNGCTRDHSGARESHSE
jgi:hypothetical protein